MKIKETNLKFRDMSLRSKVGWAGIGYHFYIRKDGTIYKGRDEKYAGAHCENYNSVSLGICLEGNFEIEKPTEKQIQSVTDLVKYLRKKYGNFKLVGHKDLNATACPGQYLYSQLLSIDANANEEYVKVFMSNNKLSVVLDNGDKFTHSFTDKNELLRKLSIGLKIMK